jgi:predicted secreted protein
MAVKQTQTASNDFKQNQTTSCMQPIALKTGIMTGVASALYLFVFYSIDKTFAINPIISLGSLVVVVVGMVIACVRQRTANGGSLIRQEALKTAFAVAVVSGLFFYGFMYLLFSSIDPSLNELLHQNAVASNPALKDKPYKMSFGNVLMGYAFSLLYGFLLSLMVANFVKK